MFLNVPLDVVSPEDIPEVIGRMLLSGDDRGDLPPGNGRNIVLLSLWDLLRARRNNEYRQYVLNAALVFPISKSIIRGARFLTGTVPFRYMPFHFVISLLSILELRENSIYLLGSGSKVLKKAERNIHSTFPRLNIVGRCPGRVRKQDESVIIEAIRKASPALLLAGKGIHGEELWIARNSDGLNSGFRLWCSDLFEVFAEKRRRPGDAVFEKGLEGIGYCFQNPLKFFRIFSWIRYKILLLYYRLIN
jgi:N-acetylglucosaminyldiphosphoundecaprenol N-acetyl-beta-D-mannosaminyltransferase